MMPTTRYHLASLVALTSLLFADQALGQRQREAKPAPSLSEHRYGPHQRNDFDLWLADSDTPTPLVLYIHGGGFSGGSKNSLNAGTLKSLLKAKISVAALHYRLIQHKKLPAAHQDCKRAVQYLRHNASRWNIDKGKVGAFGGSAGAQLCMWLAFHDEMADPTNSNPIARESTRLTCVATSGGQTTMDLDWWQQWIPGYDKPHRQISEYLGELNAPQREVIIDDISALRLISADDPPIYMSYGMAPDAPIPSDPQRARGWKVHHVMFGVKLQERMNELNVESDLKYPGANPRYQSTADFFIAHLRASPL